MDEVRTEAFALPLPAGWADRTVVTLAGPDDDGYAPNVVVTRERLCDHMGLGAFADGWVRRLGEEVPVQQVRPVEHAEIGGRRAQVRIVGWAAAGLRLTQIAFLLVDGDDAYAIVGTATDWRFAEIEPTFREIAAGFRLAQGAPT